MKEKYIEDLKEIKALMNRSTRFISLSGLSGVSTGLVALAGVYIAYHTVFKEHDYLVYHALELRDPAVYKIFLIALGTLIIAIGSAVFFTNSNTKKLPRSLWDQQVKNLLINLLIPLTAGGLLCILLLLKGFVGILPPLTLIFYGLALVNSSPHTFPEIRTLGFIEIIIGLIAIQFVEYGLFFWGIGFGVIQIIYGLIVQKKYKL